MTGGPIVRPPDPCAAVADGASTGVAESSAGETPEDNGFKFDVGAPDGAVGFAITCADVDDVPSNLGCRFWAVDLPNDPQGTSQSPPAADQPFALVVANVSALADAHVDIFVGSDDTPLSSGTVVPGATEVFDLGTANIDPLASSRDGVAFRIDSDVPVAAYQFNPAANTVQVYSNDASLLLPEQTLGTEYTAATVEGILLGSATNDPDPIPAGAFVSVVATVDGTLVEFTATSPLLGVQPSPLTLDRGQVLTLISDPGPGAQGDLSGTAITADHPVAVFAGNVATALPVGAEVCCADHVEHQMFPQAAWGSKVAVAPPPRPDGGNAPGHYRLIGGPKGAGLTYCPSRPEGAPTDLGPGEVAAFTASDPFVLVSDDDESFSLTRFTLSNTEVGPGDLGDPSMVAVAPTGQYESRSVFAVPPGYVANWATIVVRGTGTVRMDGVAISDDSFAELGSYRGSVYRYAHVQLQAGTHYLESAAPAGVTVVGYDTAVAYGFLAGSGVRALSIPSVQE